MHDLLLFWVHLFYLFVFNLTDFLKKVCFDFFLFLFFRDRELEHGVGWVERCEQSGRSSEIAKNKFKTH